MVLLSIPFRIHVISSEVSFLTHLLPSITDNPPSFTTSFQVDTTTGVDELVPTPPSDTTSATFPPNSDLPTTTEFFTSNTPPFVAASTSTNMPEITTSHATFQISDPVSDFATPTPSTTTGMYITSTIVTTIDGTATTIFSQILLPTTLASSNALTGSKRTAVIVASTFGFVFLLILALFIFFCRSRQQRKKQGLIEAATVRQKQQFSRAMLLHGEDFDNNASHGTYRHDGSLTGDVSPTDIQSLSMRFVHSSPPILLRARGSETGSIFHEEVWPPPGENSRLVDPLTRASSEIDLSSIIDDVMGPAPPHRETSSPIPDDFPSPTSAESPTYYDQQRLSSFSDRSYEWSNMSHSRLLPSDSSGSIARTTRRNSSPLARNSIDATSDGGSFHDSRIWLHRSPKRTSNLGQEI